MIEILIEIVQDISFSNNVSTKTIHYKLCFDVDVKNRISVEKTSSFQA